MVERYAVLFKFNVDANEGIQLIQESLAHIKKCVRKMIKKYDIFAANDVIRIIQLTHSGVEKQYQLRITRSEDLIYTTEDPSYKGDWNPMGFATVYVEPANVNSEINAPEKIGKSPTTPEMLKEIRTRLDKLENLLNSPSHTPIKQSAQNPTPLIKSTRAPSTSTCEPTAPSVSTPGANQNSVVKLKSPTESLNNGAKITTPKEQAAPALTAKVSPINFVNGIVSKDTPKKSNSSAAEPKPAQSTVPGKPVQSTVPSTPVQSTVPPKPAPVKAIPAKPAASRAKKSAATKFLVPYNVSIGNNPTPLGNSTPLVSNKHPVGGDLVSSSSQKRPLDTSGEAAETPAAKKKPRQEPTSDPGALAHLEEIIDAVAVGLDNPDDFSIESPFTQTPGEQSAVEEETAIMDYHEFVESLPKKKKKSKKHRHSKENESNSVLE